MAPEPPTTGPTSIEQAIEAIRARINALNDRDRELTIALLTGRDPDAAPSPDAPDARLPARLQHHPAPVRPASLHVRLLCLADQPGISAIPVPVVISGT